MSLFKRGNVWWYKFKFNGSEHRESSKSESKQIAKDAERNRRRELEMGFNGISKTERARLFSVAADNYTAAKKAHVSERTLAIDKANLAHILPVFGKMLLTDIIPDDIAEYQSKRLEDEAAAKTVNLEVGTIRAIMRKNRLWENLKPDVRQLKVRMDIGKALTADEEIALLAACRDSRSRSLYNAVMIALQTCMRYSEIRLMRWSQIDFTRRTLTVGDSKTDAGTGRVIPLNNRAFQVLSFWADLFPDRKPNHFVFAAEKYGVTGHKFGTEGHKTAPCIYDADPNKPIGDWKEAWEAAKERAGVTCRFHDLRHTGCTRMLEGGVPFAVVADVMGWSASTAIRMAKRYGHIGHRARTDAMNVLCAEIKKPGVQKRVQSKKAHSEAYN
jgi:integrase